jgi:hypothetical protein
MECPHCNRPMRRINPEPESWIRWTPLYWCVNCHRFAEVRGLSNVADEHARGDARN